MKQTLRFGLVALLIATMLIGTVPIKQAQAQDAPDIKPRIFLPAVNGANDVLEVPRGTNEELAKSLGIPGQILPVNTGEIKAAGTATVNVLSAYGSFLTIAGVTFFDIIFEFQNPDAYTCATNISVDIRIQKTDGTYYYTTGGAYLDVLMPGKRSPGTIRRSFADIGGTPTGGATLTTVHAEDCATAAPDVTFRSIPVTGYATSVYSPNPMDGTQYTGVVTNTTGFPAEVTVVATSYLTSPFMGVAVFAGLAQISVVDQVILDPGQSYNWTTTRPGGTGGPKYGGFPVAFEAIAWDYEDAPNSWWDWSSGTTSKRTAGYNPGGSASTGQISLMSGYGEQAPYVYQSAGGAYVVNALLRNNNPYAAACYVTFNMRLYHTDNSYQTVTGSLYTEGLPGGAILPAAAIIPANQITGGLSNAAGWAITGGNALECEPGQSFGALATSNTSKALQGSGDIWYAGTVTDNNAKPTGNITGAYVVLNSNGSIRSAGALTPEGEGEQSGVLDAWASKTFAGASGIHVSPTLNTLNTTYNLQATWYTGPWGVTPLGAGPTYAWSTALANGITVESDDWAAAMISNGNGTFTTYYGVTAKVKNGTNAWVCDVTLNSMFILDTGYFTPGADWPVPSAYTGHSLQKCIPPGGTTVINNTIPRNATPQYCCFSYYVLGGTYTLSTQPVTTLTPSNTAASFVTTGGYYTATLTNNTAYTYTQVYADADIYGYPTTSKIRYGLPLTSTDTLFTPGESIQITGRNWVIAINGSNPTYFRAQALP